MKSKFSFNLEVSLIEIIISVLIMAIAGVIILNCFAMARFTQIKSNDKVFASIEVQNIIELIKTTSNYEDIDSTLQNYYSEKETVRNGTILFEYYDKDWKKCSSENKGYLMTVEIINNKTTAGSLNDININVQKMKPYPLIKSNNESIYSVNTKKFYPAGGL